MFDSENLLRYAFLALGSYFLGSLPTGVLVARRYRNVDLTRVGSQKTGATNVARTLGLGAGAIVLVGDLSKGALAVWLAQQLIGSPIALGIAWLFAVWGHMHSVFLHWRGGRGVGTGLGGLAIILLPLFALAVATGTGVVAVTRFVSLGSICGAIVALVGCMAAYAAGAISGQLLPFGVLVPLLILWAHRDNIQRLRAGEERRLGQRTPVLDDESRI
ncbi:MAG: glycerol-3-phosphate 1-O-acyltransferase PlsY [Chloroflexi bacterium]|nr:glycerol-3-phosphate 1-O-acyltransferase PlsY [Chloroflexota bacterium]